MRIGCGKAFYGRTSLRPTYTYDGSSCATILRLRYRALDIFHIRAGALRWVSYTDQTVGTQVSRTGNRISGDVILALSWAGTLLPLLLLVSEYVIEEAKLRGH